MRNRLFKIRIFLIPFILLFLGTTSFANVKIENDTTQIYNTWQSLTEDQKEETIEPSLFSLNIEDSVRKSILNGFSKGVGTTVYPTEYGIQNFNIRNQRHTNECWAFSTATLIETNLAQKRNIELILSPRHIDYATSRNFLDGVNQKGFNREVGMGNFYISLSYCTNGTGPVLESDMPFEDNANLINLNEINKTPVLKLEDYRNFASIMKIHQNGTTKYTNGVSQASSEYKEYTETEVEGMRNLIKEHIMEYGAVSGYTYLGSNFFDYVNMDNDVASYYNDNTSNSYDHAITIVGWNDNYPASSFKEGHRPSKNGAYLVLNTSTADIDKLSLFAISYEDVWIEYANFGVVATDDIDYDKIYQYDEYGYNMPLTLTDDSTGNTRQSGYIANVFQRTPEQGQEEYLNEVSIYVPKTTNVDIYVNTNSNDKTQIQKVAAAGILDPGYHTIKLSTPLKLTGNRFVIAAKLTSDAVVFATETNAQSNGYGSTFWDYATSELGQSFISLDGNTWTDLNLSVRDSNVCLKAFTTYQEQPASTPTPTPTPIPTPTLIPTPTPTPTPTQMPTPTPTPTPTIYEFFENTQYQEFTLGKQNDIVFRINADYDKFLNIKMNGVLVESDNYTISRGSTIITLNNSYVNTLPEGENQLTVNFTDGTATARLQIERQTDDSIGNNVNENDNSNIVKIENVSISEQNKELKVGESYTVIAQLLPSNATNKNVRWSSSDTNVAVVSQTGIVTAIKEGTALIKVVTEDGEKEATITITIKGEIPDEDKIYYNEDNSINATPTTGGSSDNTTAKGLLPQTGSVTIITILIILTLGITTIYISIKIRKMDDIK